jgi:hypothetical protein
MLRRLNYRTSLKINSNKKPLNSFPLIRGMSEGQGVLWNFKVKLKTTVPLGQLPYQGATGNFWLNIQVKVIKRVL